MLTLTPAGSEAAVYEVGPGRGYTSIGAVPWETLVPGDHVLIHWRSTPYAEKWVLARQGTASAPIVIRGVPGPAGERPVIDGSNATTRTQLRYWNQERGLLKIGGASVPADTMPQHLVVDGLEFRNARQGLSFLASDGTTRQYTANAAAIYVEKVEHLVIRNCVLTGSGNGLFIGSDDSVASRNVLVERSYLHGNGNLGSAYEHNSYTSGVNVVFQFNRLGPLASGAGGSNLKDRSAGLVVRYNWIDGGNRQLDLVDAPAAVRADAGYRTTLAYGNILIEPAGAGNQQMVHYGGDSGAADRYRAGVLYMYQNTFISHRTDRTTLLRLSSAAERADVRNNIIYLSRAGSMLSLLDSDGALSLGSNWLTPGWVGSFGTLAGSISMLSPNVESDTPCFQAGSLDYRITPTSPCWNAGGPLSPALSANALPLAQYVTHLGSEQRPQDGRLDIGAYEAAASVVPQLQVVTTTLPAATQGESYSVPLAAEGGVAPYQWVTAEPLPGGLTIGSSSGVISGIPAGSGTFTVTVQVTDAQVPAALSRQTMSLQVSPATTTTVNRPPVVTMESPSAATTVKFGKFQRLSAAASDTDGSVVRVDFFAGTALIHTADVAPYSATWRPPARGTYSLTAVAVDNGGASTRSAAVQVTVK